MISQQLAALVHDARSVTTQLAASTPETTVEEAAKNIYPHAVHRGSTQPSVHDDTSSSGPGSGHDESKIHKVMKKLHLASRDKEQEEEQAETPEKDQDHLEKLWEHQYGRAWEQWQNMELYPPERKGVVESCGQWGASKPSDLFLQMYAQALRPLDDDPLHGMVSPSLMGSSGVVVLSIISVIPDIIQHHADVIVRAEHEIFLATNFWEASGAAKTITDALRELSNRVVEARRAPVVVKLMYDRGNPRQVLNPHQPVDAETYVGDKVKLPHPDQVPGLRLEVQNYHEPPVGTFHAKYMVVDRKIAILNSNNIQDRVNVEMMVHIEGPIVQGFYDLALLSWWNVMDPPLPLLARPPTYAKLLTKDHFDFGNSHPVISDKGDIDANSKHTRNTLRDHHAAAEEHLQDHEKSTKWDSDNTSEATRVDSQFNDESAITSHLNTGTKIAGTDNSPPPNAELFKPVILHSPHDPVPMALVCRPPRGKPGHGDTFVPQDQAFLAGFKFAQRKVFVQTPTFNAWPVVQAALDAARRHVMVEIYADLGFNDEGELLPFQGGTNEMVSSHMYSQLDEEQKKYLKINWYTGKDQKTPLNAKDKSRNCHVKLMIVDEAVIIQGNGNQDTQSWFHSQEVNIMIDSSLLAGEIRDGIDSNQNTLFYGAVDPKDGIWRDATGNVLPGTKPPPKGVLKSFVGVKGAIQRVRGEGGF